MATGAVRVKGLREMNKAFTDAGKEVQKKMRNELKEVAEPVRAVSEQLAVGNITNIGAHWSRMRLGATAKSVDVLPASRRAGGSRRANLATLLVQRSMEPALDRNRDRIADDFNKWVDGINARHDLL